jgi:hypothetical protein
MIHAILICSLGIDPCSVGLVYAILSAMLSVLAMVRRKHSNHDFSDEHKESSNSNHLNQIQMQPYIADHVRQNREEAPGTLPEKRVFGRPFVTAGWIVIALTAVVGSVEGALLVLIARL